MKLSPSTSLLAATMVGYASAQASVEFDPINFLQFDGSCEGKLLYAGEITGVKKIDEGKFCVSDVLHQVDGEKIVYSRLDIIKCAEDKIYENWFLCEDSDCASCDLEYRAYTSWDDVHPDDEIKHCYDYQYSTDSLSALQRNVMGPLENTQSVDYMFGPNADPADVAAYRGFIHENSCVADGKPSEREGVVASPYFDPITFLQFKESCEGELMYAGQITGLKKLGEGKFCVSDILQTEDGDREVYSRMDVIKCAHDKVYENWFLCEDRDCSDCELEYRAFTSWNDVHPEGSVMDHCYDYQYATDEIAALQRNVMGPIGNTKSVDYMFGPNTSEDDVGTYRGFIHENSCIANGQPAAPTPSVDATAYDDVEDARGDVSASSVVSLTSAIVAMSWAAMSMLL